MNPVSSDRWQLPAGIREVLPAEAAHMERLRRTIIDLFNVWGYELVVTPMIEYLESLLTGTGPDLDLRTFKLIDQLTGRSMGIRADMTPQVARIDAHHLKREGAVRLCYLGTVLHTVPDGYSTSRTPIQVGAELYGHSGPESDCEILCLMLETLEAVGIDDVHIGLGHMGIFRGLAVHAGLSEDDEATLFDALQRKARTEVEELLFGLGVNADLCRQICGLVELNGSHDVIPRARTLLAGADSEVLDALDRLDSIQKSLHGLRPELKLHFDLSELRGYRYERGVVFAAYVPGHGDEVARGGRYDGIGEVFGRARPAIGFSTDLQTLASAASVNSGVLLERILAPAHDDTGLRQEIAKLRSAGRVVVQAFPGETGDSSAQSCSHELVLDGTQWIIKERQAAR